MEAQWSFWARLMAKVPARLPSGARWNRKAPREIT